ncbi:MAG: restriction endonuclease [Anaerolineales bacterium]|nr:restriction endonuclease [Anaerolineales bacterium]
MARNSRSRRRNKSAFSELLWDGLLIVALGFASNTPWLKSIAILILALGFIYIGWRLFRYFRITRPLDIHGVDEMSGTEFERFVAHLLKSQGYSVEHIGGYDDFGVDLIASRGGRKHAIQVKRWKQPVGVDAIRAAVAGMAFHKCDRAVVITNSKFSWRAQKLAEANNCKLIDRTVLAEQIRKAS